MKLGEASQLLYATADTLSETRLALESLGFCTRVFRAYDSGDEAANEHMDATKAKAQLLDAIDRLLNLNEV